MNQKKAILQASEVHEQKAEAYKDERYPKRKKKNPIELVETVYQVQAASTEKRSSRRKGKTTSQAIEQNTPTADAVNPDPGPSSTTDLNINQTHGIKHKSLPKAGSKSKSQYLIEYKKTMDRVRKRRMREEIKNDPIKREQAKQKEHERYLKRKQQGKVREISKLSKKEQRKQRKKWAESTKRYRSRICIEHEELEQVQSTSSSKKRAGRKVLRDQAKVYKELVKVREQLKRTIREKDMYKKRFYRLQKKMGQKEESPQTKEKYIVASSLKKTAPREKRLMKRIVPSCIEEVQTFGNGKKDVVSSETACRVVNEL